MTDTIRDGQKQFETALQTVPGRDDPGYPGALESLFEQSDTLWTQKVRHYLTCLLAFIKAPREFTEEDKALAEDGGWLWILADTREFFGVEAIETCARLTAEPQKLIDGDLATWETVSRRIAREFGDTSPEYQQLQALNPYTRPAD